MIRYIVLIALIATGCGRKRDDIHLENDKANLNVVSSNLNYDHRSDRNVVLNKKIEDVSVGIRNGDFSREITVALKPKCLDVTLKFRGEMPSGPYSKELELISGNTNVDVGLKCLDGSCKEFIVTVKDQEKDPGIYPILMSEEKGILKKKWSPKHFLAFKDKRYLTDVDICKERDLRFQKKIKLFVDVDESDDNLNWYDSMFLTELVPEAEKEVKRVCQKDIGGTFLRTTLRAHEHTFLGGLRGNISTDQYEYDDFVFGECIYSDKAALSGEFAIYDIGETKESAIRKVQKYCVNDLYGVVHTDDYLIESHQISGRSSWIAKLHCLVGDAEKNYFF